MEALQEDRCVKYLRMVQMQLVCYNDAHEEIKKSVSPKLTPKLVRKTILLVEGFRGAMGGKLARHLRQLREAGRWTLPLHEHQEQTGRHRRRRRRRAAC
jgi:hypothetical protein